MTVLLRICTACAHACPRQEWAIFAVALAALLVGCAPPRAASSDLLLEGWTMRASQTTRFVIVQVMEPEAIRRLGIYSGLGDGALGIAWLGDLPLVMVPPLNTAEDMKVWRHEFRHALTDWRHDAPLGPPTNLLPR